MPAQKISVALCTYNGGAWLSAQLTSILKQSLPVSEIVICDDGSKDNTLQIVREFEKIHPRVIRLYINAETLHVKKNFEKAILRCTGDIIFLSDQDDIWEFEKVRTVVDYFDMHPRKNVVFTNAFLLENNKQTVETAWDKVGFSEERKIILQHPVKMLEQLLLKGNLATGATMALRSSVIKTYLPFAPLEKFWHDHLLALQAAASDSLGFIDECLISYRLHPKQQIGFRKRNVPTYFQPIYRVLQVSKKLALASKTKKEKKEAAVHLRQFAGKASADISDFLNTV